MKAIRFKGVSLLLRLLLATSAVVSGVFAITGWLMQDYAAGVSQRSLEEEVQTSLKAYESVWAARKHNLTSISSVIASMSDVRAAFMTRDGATIRDTAQELWSRVSDQDASFLVLDPTGSVIASLGGVPGFSLEAADMAALRKRFPNQVSGYLQRDSHLFYVVLTPVYVQAGSGSALLNILLVSLDIDEKLANALKSSTNDSDFVFEIRDDVVTSTIPNITATELKAGRDVRDRVRKVDLPGGRYLLLSMALNDPWGALIGQLYIIRSFAGPEAALARLRETVAAFWIIAVVVALALTFLLARRILGPVKRLDRAASEVIKRNYDYRVPVETSDELGRLAETFNTMCDSLRTARAELIRQEQIATIGRLSSSIVHDLRNPLAAIYGGAEMLVDADLSPELSKRLAANIYSASRRIQELLQELLDVSRSKTRPVEVCRLSEITSSALEAVQQTANRQEVIIDADVADDITILADRDRIERVLINLMDNALDAMPDGGAIKIRAKVAGSGVLVEVEDTGKGIADEVWNRLFQPFASFGKKNGLGLGLALSRQTLLDHKGDLWAEKKSGPGARFVLRLPRHGAPKTESTAETSSTITLPQ